MTNVAIFVGIVLVLLTIAAYFSLERKEFIRGSIVIGGLVAAFVLYMSYASGRGLTGLVCDIVYGYKACETRPAPPPSPEG